MEHRHYHRRKINLPAQLRDKKGGAYSCRLSDVAREGVSLIVEGAEFAIGAVVDIDIPYITQLGSGTRNFTAYVVHRTDNRLGLLWLKGCRLDGLLHQTGIQLNSVITKDAAA